MTSAHTVRVFTRQDGTRFSISENDGYREVARHRAPATSWGELRLAQFGSWVRGSQYRFDSALAVVSFFLVMGTVFLAFGLVAFGFGDSTTGWTFWLIGFGLWGLSLTFFFSFLDWPQPRHGRNR